MKRFDNVSDAIRRTMKANKGKDTKPEMVVRRLTHGLGYRYALHRRDLPGKPDMAFPARKAIIEVRGCFWHRHPGCRLAYIPKTRKGFWEDKFDANVARDARNTAALENRGWKVLTVWECETTGVNLLADKIKAFLGPGRRGVIENRPDQGEVEQIESGV